MSHEPSVRPGDEITLRMSNMGKQGDAAGKHEGMVVFVPKAHIGKEYRVIIKKVFENFAIGEIKNEL